MRKTSVDEVRAAAGVTDRGGRGVEQGFAGVDVGFGERTGWLAALAAERLAPLPHLVAPGPSSKRSTRP